MLFSAISKCLKLLCKLWMRESIEMIQEEIHEMKEEKFMVYKLFIQVVDS